MTQMLSKQYFTFTNRSYFDGFGYFCLHSKSFLDEAIALRRGRVTP